MLLPSWSMQVSEPIPRPWEEYIIHGPRLPPPVVATSKGIERTLRYGQLSAHVGHRVLPHDPGLPRVGVHVSEVVERRAGDLHYSHEEWTGLLIKGGPPSVYTPSLGAVCRAKGRPNAAVQPSRHARRLDPNLGRHGHDLARQLRLPRKPENLVAHFRRRGRF